MKVSRSIFVVDCIHLALVIKELVINRKVVVNIVVLAITSFLDV